MVEMVLVDILTVSLHMQIKFMDLAIYLQKQSPILFSTNFDYMGSVKLEAPLIVDQAYIWFYLRPAASGTDFQWSKFKRWH